MRVALAVLAALALLLYLLLRARAGWRRFVRAQVRAELAERAGVAVVKEERDCFEIRIGASTGKLYLGNLFAGLASGSGSVTE